MKMRKWTFLAVLFFPYVSSAASAPPLQVVVLGNLWELPWVEHVLSLVPDLVQSPPWQRVKSQDELVALLHPSEGPLSTHEPQRLILVTNIMDDPRIYNMLVNVRATHALSGDRARPAVVDGLVVVDEFGVLSDLDCRHFQFVVRVGFSHYPRRGSGFMLPLWQQPKNAVIVPLGVPAPFPLLDGLRTEFQISRNGMKNTIHVAVAEGALHKRKSVATRTFFSAFLGRIQNENRRNMARAVSQLHHVPDGHIFHDMDVRCVVFSAS